MEKFRENELTEKLKEFQEKTTIELEFEESIEGKIELEDTTVKYDAKRGYINIENKESNIRINTALVCEYQKTENEICIDLESTLLKIRKLN